MKKVKVRNHVIGEGEPLTIISGPCVIEGEDEILYAASFLKNLFLSTPFQFIFKSSYDKANRSSINSYRGPGLEKGLKILAKVKRELDIPVFTDVHTAEEAIVASEVCDMIQIPAFLCRQTDLLVAAGKTGCAVNVKKGQFMAPWDMKNALEKIMSTGNERVTLTERGTSFGYNNLVSDMRSIAIMKKWGYPVFFDATHSVQLPGGNGDSTGGQKEFVPLLIRASIASGVNGIYAEAHPNPSQARSDKECQLAFEELPHLVKEWERLYEAVNGNIHV